MTDTRKEFERAVSNLGWAFDYIGDGQYGSHTIQFANKLWHACQSINDKRIEQLLAVIAKKDEALKLCTVAANNLCLTESLSADVDRRVYSIGKAANKALALQSWDVDLVDASNISDAEWNRYKSTGEGMKLYTIKTKANTK